MSDSSATPTEPTTPVRGPLERLRARPDNPHAFRGYGPLLALAVLIALIVVLAPTVAPEQIVLRPTDATTTTVTVASGGDGSTP